MTPGSKFHLTNLHILMRTAFLMLLCFALSSVGGRADTLAQLRKSFMERYDAANKLRDDQLKKLDDSYLGALERQVDKTKATGKLDAVIPFIDEIQAIKAAKDPLPDLSQQAPLELKRMRVKQAEARDKILKTHAETLSTLSEKMETALKSQESELTKAGKIEEALATKQLRETLASDQGLANAREKLATSRATSTGTWRSLLEEPLTVVGKGHWEVAVLSKSVPENKPFVPLIDILKRERKNPAKVLMAIPNSIVDFKPEVPATQIRGTCALKDPGGTVVFRIFANGRLVVEKEIQKQFAEVPFEASFPATRSIRLETDMIENDAGDCAAWLNPEIR